MVPSRGPWDDPGTILGRSWDSGGHKEGPCEVQAWILSICCWFRDPFWQSFGYFWRKKEDLFIAISRLLFLMIFWSKFECQGIQKQAFGMEGIAKINFRRDWISYDSRVDFSWYWVALGLIFMVFVGLEAGSKIDDFSGFPGGTPELRERTSRVLKCLFWGAGKQHSYRYHPSVLRLKLSRR